jgi:hypothetical protein
MSASAVACPHCGTRQADRDPLPEHEAPAPGPMAKTKLSSEEVAALLAVESANAPAPASGPGLFQVLLLPHPMTAGIGRFADVVLTLCALPLIFGGFLLLLLFGRRRGFAVVTRQLRGRVELTAALFAAVLGTASLALLGTVVPLPIEVPPLILAAIGSGALLVRVIVRNAAEK